MEFKLYMDTINTLHKTIKFTYECSDHEITFLDDTLYNGFRFHQDGILDMKTHIEPTNKQLYVYAISYHPPKTGKSIMLGETNRYLHTNLSEENFHLMMNKFSSKLRI